MSGEPEPAWSASLIDPARVRAWITDVLPGHPHTSGPVNVHRSNAWGVTARFAATDGSETSEVVFKANFLPMTFAGPAVYELLARCCPADVPDILASVEESGRRWELFAVFEGETVGTLGRLEPVINVARTIARIQTAVAACPGLDTANLLRTPVERVPAMYDELFTVIEGRFLPAIGGDDEAFARAHGLPRDAVRTLAAARPAVSRWADELAAGRWPLSIHHVDLHPNNAVRRDGGSTLIFDWEEADLGFPLFVLDKLLIEAARWWGPTGADAVRAAYLDTLPWATRDERERAFDLAQLLSPVRYAHADLRFADAMGWDPSGQVASWLAIALRRWSSTR